jgi:hypothetical protein
MSVIRLIVLSWPKPIKVTSSGCRAARSESRSTRGPTRSPVRPAGRHRQFAEGATALLRDPAPRRGHRPEHRRRASWPRGGFHDAEVHQARRSAGRRHNPVPARPTPPKGTGPRTLPPAPIGFRCRRPCCPRCGHGCRGWARRKYCYFVAYGVRICGSERVIGRLIRRQVQRIWRVNVTRVIRNFPARNPAGAAPLAARMTVGELNAAVRSARILEPDSVGSELMADRCLQLVHQLADADVRGHTVIIVLPEGRVSAYGLELVEQLVYGRAAED